MLRPVDLKVSGAYFISYSLVGKNMESAINVKGQVTIPSAVRDHRGLKPGDRVKFFVHPDGSVVILPKLPVTVLRGMLKSRKSRAAAIQQLPAPIADHP